MVRPQGARAPAREALPRSLEPTHFLLGGRRARRPIPRLARDKVKASMALLAAGVLALLGVYGFFHEGLATQTMWSPDGAPRIETFTVLYWAAASILLWLNRGMHLWVPA